MAQCNDNVEQPGSDNPIQSAVQPADYTNPAVNGDNSLIDVPCDSTVSVGDVVRISAGSYIKAQSNSTTNSRVIGICVSKLNATTCTILTTGPSGSVLSGLTENTNYFLSAATAGALTSSPPTASGETVIHIGRAISANSIVVQIGVQIRRS